MILVFPHLAFVSNIRVSFIILLFVILFILIFLYFSFHITSIVNVANRDTSLISFSCLHLSQNFHFTFVNLHVLDHLYSFHSISYEFCLSFTSIQKRSLTFKAIISYLLYLTTYTELWAEDEVIYTTITYKFLEKRPFFEHLNSWFIKKKNLLFTLLPDFWYTT